MTNRFAALLVAVPLALAPAMTAVPAAAQTASQQETLAGTLKIESTSIAAGVGVTWGSGVLTLNDGRQVRFSLRGLNLAQAGVTKVSASGRVYNMTELSQFDGTYTGVGASATVAGGRGIVRVKNESGVILELRTASRGLGLKLAAEGLRIKLQGAD